jgi:segregation and condensation protein B
MNDDTIDQPENIPVMDSPEGQTPEAVVAPDADPLPDQQPDAVDQVVFQPEIHDDQIFEAVAPEPELSESAEVADAGLSGTEVADAEVAEIAGAALPDPELPELEVPATSQPESPEAESEIESDAEIELPADFPEESLPAEGVLREELPEDLAEDLEFGVEALPESEAQEDVLIQEAENGEESITATAEELRPVIECLLFVAEEPLTFKVICKVLGTVPEEDVQRALDALIADYNERASGFEIREVAGGWRLSTRAQHHDFIRQYLKTRPSARLSFPALETLAVIAYKQPITVPEILEIRGVTSSSAIKTLLEKRLIITRGRKETVGRPMMYGTSREFMIQFGLKDLNELPSIEDFEDLSQ